MQTENNWTADLSQALERWDLDRAEALLDRHGSALAAADRQSYYEQIKDKRTVRTLCDDLKGARDTDGVADLIARIEAHRSTPPEYQAIVEQKLADLEKTRSETLQEALAQVELLLDSVKDGHPEHYDDAVLRFRELPYDSEMWPVHLASRYLTCKQAIDAYQSKDPVVRALDIHIGVSHWAKAREALAELEKNGLSQAQLSTYRDKIERGEARALGHSLGVGGGQRHDVLRDLAAVRKSATASEDYRGILNANVALMLAAPPGEAITVDGLSRTREELDEEYDRLRVLLEKKVEDGALAFLKSARLALDEGILDEAEKQLVEADRVGEPDEKKLWGLKDVVGSILLPQQIRDDVERLRRDIENRRQSRRAAELEYEVGKEAAASGTIEALRQALIHYRTANLHDDTYLPASRAYDGAEQSLAKLMSRERSAARYAFDRALQLGDFASAEKSLMHLQSLEESAVALESLAQQLDESKQRSTAREDILAHYTATVAAVKASLNTELENDSLNLLHQWRSCGVPKEVADAEEERLRDTLSRCRNYQGAVQRLDQAVQAGQWQVADTEAAKLRQVVDADRDWKRIASSLGRYYLALARQAGLLPAQIQSYLLSAKHYSADAGDDVLGQEVAVQVEAQAANNEALSRISGFIDEITALMEYNRHQDALERIRSQSEDVQRAVLRQRLLAEDALLKIQDHNAILNARTALSEGRYQDAINLLEGVKEQGAQVSALLEQARSKEREETSILESLEDLKRHGEWAALENRIKTVTNSRSGLQDEILGHRLRGKIEELKSGIASRKTQVDQTISSLKIAIPDLLSEGRFGDAESMLSSAETRYTLSSIRPSDYGDLQRSIRNAQQANTVAAKYLSNAGAMIEAGAFAEALNELNVPHGTPRPLTAAIEHLRNQCREYTRVKQAIDKTVQAVIFYLQGQDVELSQRTQLDEAVQGFEHERQRLEVLLKQVPDDASRPVLEKLGQLFDFGDELQKWVRQVKTNAQGCGLDIISTSIELSLSACPSVYPRLRTALEEFKSGWLEDRRKVFNQTAQCSSRNYTIWWPGDQLGRNITRLSSIEKGALTIGGQPVSATSWEKARAGVKLDELSELEHSRPLKTVAAYSAPFILIAMIVLPLMFLPRIIAAVAPTVTPTITPTVTAVVVTQEVLVVVTSTPTLTPTPTATPTPIPPQEVIAVGNVQLRDAANGALIPSYVTPGNHYMVNGWCELSGDYWLRIPHHEDNAWVRLDTFFNIQSAQLRPELEIGCTTP